MCKPGFTGDLCNVEAIKVRWPLHMFRKAGAIRRLLNGALYSRPERWMFLKTYHQANDWTDVRVAP